jgi:predicted DNA-binding ribbon-helix-helix protein
MRLAQTDRYLSVRVAHAEWEGLRRIADESGTTVSALVREVVEVFLDADNRAAQESAARSA